MASHNYITWRKNWRHTCSIVGFRLPLGCAVKIYILGLHVRDDINDRLRTEFGPSRKSRQRGRPRKTRLSPFYYLRRFWRRSIKLKQGNQHYLHRRCERAPAGTLRWCDTQRRQRKGNRARESLFSNFLHVLPTKCITQRCFTWSATLQSRSMGRNAIISSFVTMFRLYTFPQ